MVFLLLMNPGIRTIAYYFLYVGVKLSIVLLLRWLGAENGIPVNNYYKSWGRKPHSHRIFRSYY